MKKSFTQIESRGLPGGPNEQFTYVTGVFSTEGYKSNSPDVDNPYNIIDSGNITMEGVDFPVMGIDNLGNSQIMTPGNNYQFPGNQVYEVPMAQRGLEIAQDARMRDDIQTGQNSGADMGAGLWEAITSGAGTVADYYTELKELAGANPITKQIFNNIDPVTKLSHALDILSVPGSLIAETVEGVGGQGDGQFNITDAIPNMSGDFSFTNMNNEPFKNVAGVAGVKNPVGGFALNLFTDPSTYFGAGVAKNIIKKGIKTGAKVVSNTGKLTTEGLKDATYTIGRNETRNLTTSQLDDVVTKRKAWVNSDEYIKRRGRQLRETDKFKNASDADIAKYINDDVKSMENAFDQIVVKFNKDLETQGVYNGKDITIKTPDGSGVGYSPNLDTYLDVFDHEVLHAFQTKFGSSNTELLDAMYDIAKGKLAKGESIESIQKALKQKAVSMEDISSGFHKGQRHMTTPINSELKNTPMSGSGNTFTRFEYLSDPREQNVRHIMAIESLVSKYGYNYGKVTDDLLSKFSDDVINGQNKVGVDDLFRNLGDDAGNVLKPGSKGWKDAVRPILENAWMFPAAGVGAVLANERDGGEQLPKAQYGKEQPTLSAYEEPAWYEKAVDYLASPMTALGYIARNQDVPDALPINMQERNVYDMVFDMINPFAMAKYAAQAKRDYDNEEYLSAGLNTLGALPIVPAILAKGKKLLPPNAVGAIDDAIKSAYKYNPAAYNNIDSKLPEILQFNRENNSWLRQVGKPAIDDIKQTGVVRELNEVIDPKLFDEKLQALQNQQSGIGFSLDKRYNGPFFKKGETFFDYNKKPMPKYEGKTSTRGRSGSSDYLIETKSSITDDLFQPAYNQAMYLDPLQKAKNIGDVGIMKPLSREADNFNFYKKDWWEGYKQTPLEELQKGGSTSLPTAQDGKEMGITNELLAKQAYVESNWDPKVKNSLGYMGLGQIGDGLIADYKQKNNIKGEIDPYDPVQNAAVQRWSMNELYNTPWINKEGSSLENRLAKTLAAYNWGRGRVFDMLTEQKERGIDIYKGSEWLNDLPQETQDYIKMTITDNYNTEKRPLLQKNYLKALEDPSYSSIKSIYFKEQGGETYTIQSGDNLGKIAAKYNMDYKDLASFNNIADPNLIMPNQVLNIPDRETSTGSNTNQNISYRVKPGDSLSKIAKNYRTSVGELQRINNIENPNLIQVDQEILFPETVVRTPVEPTEPSWISTDDIKQRNDSINQSSNIDVVMKGQILHDPNERYIVIDKSNSRLKVYQGDTEVQDIEVILGKNKGDAQTVTKSSLANADQLMRIQEQLGIEVDGLLGKDTKKALANSDLSFTPRWTTDYSKGNLTTGAGVYKISNTSPTSSDVYQNAPSFNMTNEAGIEVGTSIHGTPSYRLSSFGNDNLIPGEDENNRMSSGCINGQCTDLQALYDLGLPTGTSIYILPEDEGNKFELVDGKPVLRMSQENREAYKGNYTDEKGREQTGQGGNYTTETLTYKPIRAKFDKEKFVKERFTLLDFNDDEEFDNTTQPFISALEENKKEIMLAAKIPGDVYNQIAKMAFGIYGTESEFGDTHSWVGNAARGANKKFGSDGSSPDVIKKYEGFDIPFTDIGKGAQSKDQSVGYTQMRWTQLNDKEKTALESFGITSNEDFLDPAKSAIATATVLGIRYNEQLTADQKKDVWKHLPSKWNKRANYTDRVKNNSVYLNFEQLDVLKAGGEIDDFTLYRNYINGIYNGTKQEKQAEKVYDKLNRRHYWKAKAIDMSPSNYVSTYVVGQG